MQTKYAIFNPATGTYDYVETLEQVPSKIAEMALQYYKSHSSGIAYTIVTIDDNGWETWTNPEDTRTELPQDILDNIAQNITV